MPTVTERQPPYGCSTLPLPSHASLVPATARLSPLQAEVHPDNNGVGMPNLAENKNAVEGHDEANDAHSEYALPKKKEGKKR